MKSYKEKRVEALKKLFPKPVSGKGLINTLINNLPIEAHPFGYSYLGPGTNLDLRLEKGVKPVNKLDEAAVQHDIAYSQSNDLNKRHAADKILQESAWKRVKAPDAGLGEKSMAWLTTNAMRLKKAIGAGVKRKSGAGVKRRSGDGIKKRSGAGMKKRSKYNQYPVNLNEQDKNAIVSAANNKMRVEVTVNLF